MSDQPTPTFISLDDAAAMTEGTRVTFIPGLQALYSEALKNVCFVKGISLTRALHPPMGIDKETGEDRQAGSLSLPAKRACPRCFMTTSAPQCMD